MESSRRGSCGENLLAFRKKGGEVDGLSQRSFWWDISVICGHAFEREVVKWGRSKKCVKGTAVGDSVASEGMISGIMKFGAVVC